MTKPIRVHPTDRTDAEVRSRHEAIEKRLEEMGVERVKIALLHAGFPTEWNAIAHAWLAGDKLEPEEPETKEA